jgi:hypothetical protein
MSTTKKAILALAVIAGAVGVLVLGPFGAAPEARAEGVRWESATLDEALAKAREENTRVFVKFDAAWCSVCRTLERELLDTAEGAALTEDLVAVRFDFDDPANRPLVERYVVLGLPTTLVLTPDGQQIGRISGYDTKEAFVAQIEAAKTGDDPVPALRAAHEAAPENALAMLALGEALLVRGETAEGEALLGRVAWRSGADDAAHAAEALFLLGRYHHRVRRDPSEARHVWRELATRFPDDERAPGAVWWFAKAEAELGHHAVGLAALRDFAARKGDDAGSVAMIADYVAEHDEALADAREETLARVRRALAALDPANEADTGTRDELTELETKLAR